MHELLFAQQQTVQTPLLMTKCQIICLFTDYTTASGLYMDSTGAEVPLEMTKSHTLCLFKRSSSWELCSLTSVLGTTICMHMGCVSVKSVFYFCNLCIQMSDF